MKKIALIVGVLISGVVSSQSLSFPEAVAKLQTGNKKLQGVKKQRTAKSLAVSSAKGMYYPQITLNGSYTYMADHLYLDFNQYKTPIQGLAAKYRPILGQLQPLLVKYQTVPEFQKLMGLGKQLLGKGQQLLAKDWKYKFQDQQITQLSLDVKYPIFTGGKIRTGVKVKELQEEIAEVETKKIEGILIANLAERYFQTQLAQEAIKVREQVLESAEKHLYNAQKMEENGMIAPVQTMLAKTSVADANRELLGARKDAELASTALIGLLGGQVQYSELSSPLFKLQNLKELSYYQKLAKENYPDIVKAQIQKKLTDQNVNFQKANFIPDVAIVGRKYLYTSNLPLTQPDDWYVGVGMKMDLFKGFQNKRKYQEAKVMREGVELLIEQAKVDIQTLVKKYYTQILKSQEQLESLEKSIEFAEELVRVRTKAFKENFATSTDVADANLYLASIRIKRLKAMFEIDKNLTKLLEISGVNNTFKDYMPL